ncbi:hypothetical protein BDA96_09G157500 [Sorghum bicolor]|uniref:Uncharacterized protein n=2 Tax=Sorghum bicolor TaxID=4558 RepID=A0A921QCK3_SORBI|nr:hypothetical protein BDA96_09G157500 [Sorghum bicolor]KXG22081.1 hypothetical protein SORBI_3009G150300 [Sorghum bicolor]
MLKNWAMLMNFVKLILNMKTQQVDTRKASFQWLDQAKRKQENNVWLFYLHPERHNKRAEFFL